VRSGLDVSTFATRRLHACHHARAPSGGRWNCGREMTLEFCLNADFHVTFRDLLHAVKLRHETDGFTSPPKESEDFFALKIGRLRPGANPQTWVPKASMLPLNHRSRLIHHVTKRKQVLLMLTLRRLMSYIYGAPILDVSRSHTTTQHSR